MIATINDRFFPAIEAIVAIVANDVETSLYDSPVMTDPTEKVQEIQLWIFRIFEQLIFPISTLFTIVRIVVNVTVVKSRQ